MNQVSEIRMKSGIGRIWEARAGQFSFAHPDGSEGSGYETFEEAESQLRACEFYHVYASTKLCELPDSAFTAGGYVNTLAVNAGYTSGKQWANDKNLWEVKLSEAIELL